MAQAEVHLSIRDGHVDLDARDATVQQILSEWAKVGQTRVINVEGITGKKKDFTSLPYIKIQAFSVRTASLLGLDTMMDLWFNSMGIVTFEFSGRFDIAAFNKLISNYILQAPGSH